jgi:hypothetical protein
MGRRNTILSAETLKRNSGAERRKLGTSLEEEQLGAPEGAGQPVQQRKVWWELVKGDRSDLSGKLAGKGWRKMTGNGENV